MKYALVLLILVFSVFGNTKSNPVVAAPSAFKLSNEPTNVHFDKAGLKDAVVAMMLDSGYLYKIDGSVSNNTKVTISSTDEKWSDVFNKILKQGKLKYSFNADAVMTIKKQ